MSGSRSSNHTMDTSDNGVFIENMKINGYCAHLFTGATAEIVRSEILRLRVEQVCLYTGVSVDAVRAIPDTVKFVYLMGNIPADVQAAILKTAQIKNGAPSFVDDMAIAFVTNTQKKRSAETAGLVAETESATKRARTQETAAPRLPVNNHLPTPSKQASAPRITNNHPLFEGNKNAYLEAGATADTARAIPAIVTHVFVHSGVTADAMRAIPSTVVWVLLCNQDIAADTVRAIPATVETVRLVDPFRSADLIAAIPTTVKRIYNHLGNLINRPQSPFLSSNREKPASETSAPRQPVNNHLHAPNKQASAPLITKNNPVVPQQPVGYELSENQQTAHLKVGVTANTVRAIPASVIQVSLYAGVTADAVLVIQATVKKVVLNAGVTADAVLAIPATVESVGLNIGVTASTVRALPANVRMVVLNVLTTADTVRALPVTVKRVALDAGIMVDTIRALPATVNAVMLNVGTTADVIAAIPTTVKEIYDHNNNLINRPPQPSLLISNREKTASETAAPRRPVNNLLNVPNKQASVSLITNNNPVVSLQPVGYELSVDQRTAYLKIGVTANTVRALPATVIQVRLFAGVTADAVQAIPATVRRVVLYSGVTADEVRAIPATVKGVILRDGVTPDAVRAIPATVIAVGLTAGTTADAVLAIPVNIKKVDLDADVKVDAVRAISATVRAVWLCAGIKNDVIAAIPSTVKEIYDHNDILINRPQSPLLSSNSEKPMPETVGIINKPQNFFSQTNTNNKKRSPETAGLVAESARPTKRARTPEAAIPVAPQPAASVISPPVNAAVEARLQALESHLFRLQNENDKLRTELTELQAIMSLSDFERNTHQQNGMQPKR